MITRFVLYLGCNGVDMNLKHLDTCHSFKYILKNQTLPPRRY